MEIETTEKIRCLVAKLRGPLAKFDNFAAGYSEAADAIDALLAEVEAAAADKRDALDMVKRLMHEFDAYHYHGCPADKIPPEPCDCFAGALMNEARALAQRQGEGS